MIAKQITAQLAPVPRALSASCGTCVRYSAESDLRECLDRDYEKVVEVLEADTYRTLLENH